MTSMIKKIFFYHTSHSRCSRLQTNNIFSFIIVTMCKIVQGIPYRRAKKGLVARVDSPQWSVGRFRIHDVMVLGDEINSIL